MKSAYDAFRTQHALPDLRLWVDLEDQISAADVRIAFHEKLMYFVELLENMLWPEGIAPLAETVHFTDQDQERIQVLYYRVMLAVKDCTLLEIQSSPAEDIEFVKRLVAQGPSLVLELRELVEKTKRAYDGSKLGASAVSYLG